MIEFEAIAVAGTVKFGGVGGVGLVMRLEEVADDRYQLVRKVAGGRSDSRSASDSIGLAKRLEENGV
jgi:hypothetical protein